MTSDGCACLRRQKTGSALLSVSELRRPAPSHVCVIPMRFFRPTILALALADCGGRVKVDVGSDASAASQCDRAAQSCRDAGPSWMDATGPSAESGIGSDDDSGDGDGASDSGSTGDAADAGSYLPGTSWGAWQARRDRTTRAT
jgi:hypothetical protein